ncbi:DNA segregation ATPase FtsK/SpoIIIE, S-DNA-T family [Paramicrobacterium humi]|uniref:DNA segregation ATPase FtsK/SpoIIIE, S-DNA-T family n=1 Tax=Paramicrobacterium humi TaxID=640635 RepID=A0A1H4PEX0_9MICO|nr:FtsK/SpoIIIE domain-containing protein [Microbacterium humi]SEC05965.1 DNA segregation ATPase FtsK/SpoIIIE, S-DNA-T family [Microbacterium humi]
MAFPTEIRVPAVPGTPPRSPFPFIASLAPVVASVAISAVTRSPYVLMFAILGPVIAIASVVDSRLFARRSLRKQEREYQERLVEVRELVSAAHDGERRSRLTASPTAREVLADAGRASRWRASTERARTITLGLGDRPSGVVLGGAAGDEAHTGLREHASTLAAAPCTADATLGIGVVGATALARAVARGYLLQLCHAVDPTRLRIVALPDEGWEWARSLPHLSRRSADAAMTVSVVEDATAPAVPADITLAVARVVDAVPAHCREIIECSTGLTATWMSADNPADRITVLTHPVTAAAAHAYAAALSALAAETGVVGEDGEPPVSAHWDDLARDPDGGALSVPIGLAARSSVSVDLVEHGPHAIIGGTTGSGKSELLAKWVLGLAAAHSPSEVSMLLVDFKGGATFAPLQRLPHVVGVITDLDPAAATRALESLRAEVRYRERTLREHGVQDIAELRSGLARLVIVVDEFAAMLEGFPELHALFVDIAARGRSLGMHLVLCTQRPTGVVRDSLLANCTLRLSLRVNNRADALAVTGVDTAASLPVTPAGRCVVVTPDADPVVAQIARVSDADIAAVAARHAGEPRPRRPWLDPLPPRIPLERLACTADAFTLGLRDVPAQQKQEPAVWRPATDGSLLVLGGARSGKTTLAQVIAAQSSGSWHVDELPDDLERAFDVLEDSAERAETALGPSTTRSVLTIDDLDVLCGRLDDDDVEHARGLLTRLLRSGPRAGICVVATAQRLGAGMSALAALFDSTMLLRMPSRAEHILCGGDTATWSEDRRAGNGVWGGTSVQLAYTTRMRRRRGARALPELDLDAEQIVLVSCRRPAQTARTLRERHPGVHIITLGPTPVYPAEMRELTSVVVVGDADAWQANWSLLAALRSTATVVVEACPLVDYRALTRTRARPPYLHRQPGRAWRIAADGHITRCAL